MGFKHRKLINYSSVFDTLEQLFVSSGYFSKPATSYYTNEGFTEKKKYVIAFLAQIHSQWPEIKVNKF